MVTFLEVRTSPANRCAVPRWMVPLSIAAIKASSTLSRLSYHHWASSASVLNFGTTVRSVRFIPIENHFIRHQAQYTYAVCIPQTRTGRARQMGSKRLGMSVSAAIAVECLDMRRISHLTLLIFTLLVAVSASRIYAED